MSDRPPSRETLPVRDPPPDASVGGMDVRVHGVVLAAGRSTGYGEANKLLAPVDGEPMVAAVVRTAVASVAEGPTVVVGHEAAAVRGAVAPFDVPVRRNADYDDGQSTSVATGVAAARERDADAVVVFLGDMPHVSAATVDVVVGTYAATDLDAVAPAHEGRRGNPVLFDSRHFDRLAALEGDVGGRQVLLESPGAAAVETGDPGVLADVDRPADR